MWKVGTAAAIVLLIVLTIQVLARGHDHAQHQAPARPRSGAAARTCARQVIDDWVRDGRIRGGYRRECYQAALDMGTRGGVNPKALHGASVFADLQERLRTAG
jgi:hypothetical protein